MKRLYQNCGRISLACYVFVLCLLWHLCKYGGVKQHVAPITVAVTALAVSYIVWLVKGRSRHRKGAAGKEKRLRIEMIVFLLSTFCALGGIIYTAVPYNGALSWKIEEWTRKKEVSFVHNNLWEHGIEGIISDLTAKVKLPEELYIADEFRMTFGEDGTIQTISAFLYGKDDKGGLKTYLIDYNVAKKGKNITVWTDGEVNASFDADKKLKPMVMIVEEADLKYQTEMWAEQHESETYELLYSGRRSFDTNDGLIYIPGDADGDGVEMGQDSLAKLSDGGTVDGFAVSLRILEKERVIPMHYIMEPEYTSSEELEQEEENQQTEDVKENETWTVDDKDGSIYFFLNDLAGWRLVITDAAAGSRFYEMDRTEDGGSTWERVNTDPFETQIGVAEGLVFFDESLGFAGLSGASQTSSKMYVTRDGGATFTQVQLPFADVSALPEEAEEAGFTIEEFDYIEMPKRTGAVIHIRVVREYGEAAAIEFESEDDGATWKVAGTLE